MRFNTHTGFAIGQSNLDDNRHPTFPKSSDLCLLEGVSLSAIRLSLQQPVRKTMDGEKISAAISFESYRAVGAVCIMSWFDGTSDVGCFFPFVMGGLNLNNPHLLGNISHFHHHPLP